MVVLSIFCTARAATITTAGSGNWSSTAVDAPWPGGILPASTDDVVIRAGDSITNTANATVNSITFGSESSAPATLAVIAGETLTVTGGITLQNGANLVSAAAVIGDGTIECASVTVGGTTTPVGTPKACTLGSSVGSFRIAGNVTARSQGPGGGRANNASFAVGSGAVGIGGVVVLNADAGSTASVTLASGAQTGTLLFSNAAPFSLLGAGTTTFAAEGTAATVIYAGTAQIVHPVTYHHLTLAGSGTKTLAGFSTIAGNLILSANAVAVLGSALTVEGNLEIGSGTTFSTADYNFRVEGLTTVSGTLNHTSTSGNKGFAGDVIIQPGGIWTNAANENITFDGSLRNEGTFAAGTGVQAFSGTGGTFGGASGLSIPRVTVNGSYTNNCNLAASIALTGSGTLTQGPGSVLALGGTCTVATLKATGAVNCVNYSGAAQTVQPVAYHHLTLSGSGSKGMTTVTIIAGDLTVSGAATVTGNSGMAVAGLFAYSSSGATTLTSGTPITVGRFSQTLGTLDDGGNLITVTGSGVDTWNQAGGAFIATGTVEFVGAAPEIDAFSFRNLTLNVAEGNTATLNGAVSVDGTLSFGSGKLVTGTNVLSLGESGSFAGASSSTYVVGNVRKLLALGTGLLFAFPIGDSSSYSPIDVLNLEVTTSGYLTASVGGNSDHPDISTSGLSAGRSVNRYWALSGGGGIVTTCDLVFHYVPADVDAGADFQRFLVRRFDRSGTNWSAHSVGTRTSTSIEVGGLSAFGEFAAGEQELDHYLLSAGSPQKVGAAFLTTITAQDKLDQTVPEGSTVVVTLGSSGGGVQFDSDGNGTFGDNTKPLSDGVLSISTRASLAETLTITASDSNGKTGTSASITVNPGDQFITFNSPGDQTYGAGPIALTATASSGLAVSYQVTSGPASVDSNSLTISGAGSITVQARQTGDANWNPADPVSVTFAVSRASTSLGVVSSANPALPGTSVTFTATATALAPGAGIPTGTVTFREEAATLGTGTLDGSAVAVFTTSSLSHGTHPITAEYPGDANFAGSTNALSADQLMNTPPIPGSVQIERLPNGMVKVPRPTLLASSSDADLDDLALSVSSASANAGTVAESGNWVIYSPAIAFTNIDSFTYTVTDDHGASATGTVTVGIKAAAPSQNLTLSDLGGGSFLLQGNGIPGRTYRLQYTDTLSPPDWQDLPGASRTADSLGTFQFIDTSGSLIRAYRSAWP